MAVEKQISTRIVLTHDEYSALSNKTLREGEVVLAKVGVTEANGKVSEPIWMMKVGCKDDQGNLKTVANCPWLVAPAADVHDWAKAKEVALNGEALEFKDAAGTVIKSVDLSVFTTGTELATALGAYYTKDEADTKVADALAEAKAYVDEQDIFVTDILTVNATGGIAANTNLNGLTTHEVLKKLLYPYVHATFGDVKGTPNGGTYEKGNVQTITQVTAVVNKKSEPITKVALYNGSTLLEEKTENVANGGTFTFTGLSVKVPTDGNKLTVKATYPDENGAAKTITKDTANFTFVYPYYYGVCAEGATIDEALVEGLTKKVEGKGNKTDWSFTLNNQCIVFAYPKAHGVLTSIIDPNNFEIIGSFTKHEVSITGLDGTAQTYYVYVGGAASATDFKVDFKY